MKLRIKKLHIENFKGLRGIHIVEFGDSVTFLFGPNGYGKTTIFDALEILLTGRISRIESENNEHGGKRHASSVIHHVKDSEIVLKLLIELDGKEHVIIRKFPKSTEKLGLDKFWLELKTYIATDFESSETDPLKSLTQQELEEQIFGDSSQDYFSQYLRLLTYVPQTEAIYFLKMSQSERYSKLSPLLDMSEQSDSLEALRNYRKKLFALKGYLENKLKEYDEVPANKPKETIPYARLTQTDEMAVYDEPQPFMGLSFDIAKEKRKRISEELDGVKDFLDTFKPKEYAKLKVNNRLQQIFKNDTFIDSLIFQNITSEVLARVEQNQSLALATRSQEFLPKFVLRNHLAPRQYGASEKMRLSYLKYRSVLLDDAGEKRSVRSMLVILADKSNGFAPETQTRSSQYLNDYIRLEKSINTSQQLLKQLQEYRNHVVQHSHKLSRIVEDTQCPLCGYDWNSRDSLVATIKQKTDDLQALIGVEAQSLIEREKSIGDDFLNELISRGTAYLENNTQQFRFFGKIRQYGSLTEADIRNFDLLIGIAPETKELIMSADDLESDIASRIQKLKASIQEKVGGYNSRVVARLRNVSSYNFTSDMAFIAQIKLKLGESDVDEKALRTLTEEDLAMRADGYRKEAQGFIEKNEVISDAVSSPFLYKQLFGENEENFNKAKHQIESKINYNEQQFTIASMESRKKYLDQYSALSPLSDKMFSLSKEFDRSLKKYQFGLTQPLKAPFYVYSAKILQNNPNGQGIFIKTDADRSTIVFCANGSTTHDALHQLSSGQLAVVSMAFHLAMNAIYANKSLSLLIVDDPIQDMDSLNIHSFSELIRREFVSDYQIIMSTHDDLDMQYLKFMLGKQVKPGAIKAWNVQKLFYEPSVD